MALCQSCWPSVNCSSPPSHCLVFRSSHTPAQDFWPWILLPSPAPAIRVLLWNLIFPYIHRAVSYFFLVAPISLSVSYPITPANVNSKKTSSSPSLSQLYPTRLKTEPGIQKVLGSLSLPAFILPGIVLGTLPILTHLLSSTPFLVGNIISNLFHKCET